MSDLDSYGQDFAAELAKIVAYHQDKSLAFRNVRAHKSEITRNLRVITLAGSDGLFSVDFLREALSLNNIALPKDYPCGVSRSGGLSSPTSYYVPPLSDALTKKFEPSIKFVVMHSFGRDYDLERIRRTKIASPATTATGFERTNAATAYNPTRFATGLSKNITPLTNTQNGMHHLVSLRGDLVNSASWDSAVTHVESAGASNRALPGINVRSIGINHEEWYYDIQGKGQVREVEDHGPFSEQQYVLDAFIIKKLELYTGESFTRYLGHGAELKSNVASNTPGCFAHASASNSLSPGAEFFLPPDFRLGITDPASVPLLRDLYGNQSSAWSRRFEIWYKNVPRGEHISAYARIFAKVSRLRSFDPNTELFDPALKKLSLDVKIPPIAGYGARSLAQKKAQNQLLSVTRGQQSLLTPRNNFITSAESNANASADVWSRGAANLARIAKATSTEPPIIVDALYLDPNTGLWSRTTSRNPTVSTVATLPAAGGSRAGVTTGTVFNFGRKNGTDSDTGDPISRDPALINQAFAARVQDLFNALRALGYSPILGEGYRSPERAARLAAKGRGIVDSLHIYGLAVDIYNNVRGLGDDAFFTALAENATRLGLHSGAYFSNVDKPHVQALSGRDQTIGRRLVERPAEQEAFVKSRLG